MRRLVANLLDMTRLESGAAAGAAASGSSLEEVVGVRAAPRRRTRSRGHRCTTRASRPTCRWCRWTSSCWSRSSSTCWRTRQVHARRPPIEVGARPAGRGGGRGRATAVRASAGRGGARVREVPSRRQRRGPTRLGLGLAICRGIVAAHGGRIWAENRAGGGAAFRFTLPVAGAPPPSPRTHPNRQASEADRAWTRGPRRWSC